jgi:tRNA pseudouridine38-40 synthase
MAARARLALRLAYLGAPFAGWQVQRGQRTVQGELERALVRLFGQPIRAVGASRTDAGVHAAGQVAHADVPAHIPPAGVHAALNTMLPPEVRVLRVWRVSPSFHARRSAVAKSYRYRLAWGAPLPPWEALRRCLVLGPLDLDQMRRAAAWLTGSHDFAAFACSGHAGSGPRGTVRTLHRLDLRRRGRRVDILVEGDAFLRAMVRRMVGALVEVGRSARPTAWIETLLADPAGLPPAPTAPAHGLTLEKVSY